MGSGIGIYNAKFKCVFSRRLGGGGAAAGLVSQFLAGYALLGRPESGKVLRSLHYHSPTCPGSWIRNQAALRTALADGSEDCFWLEFRGRLDRRRIKDPALRELLLLHEMAAGGLAGVPFLDAEDLRDVLMDIADTLSAHKAYWADWVTELVTEIYTRTRHGGFVSMG